MTLVLCDTCGVDRHVPPQLVAAYARLHPADCRATTALRAELTRVAAARDAYVNAAAAAEERVIAMGGTAQAAEDMERVWPALLDWAGNVVVADLARGLAWYEHKLLTAVAGIDKITRARPMRVEH